MGAFPSTKIVSSRDFSFLPRWNFFLWHVMSSCFSRWWQGSSCQAPCGRRRGMGVIIQEAPQSSCWAADTQGWALPVLLGCPCCPWTLGHPWMARLVTQQLDTPGPSHSMLNPSWQAGVFGGTVILAAPLDYSRFQLLSEKEKKIGKKRVN